MQEMKNIEDMDAETLARYCAELSELIEELDLQEPEDMLSEEYDAWGDKHEELEDLLEEASERLEMLTDD